MSSPPPIPRRRGRPVEPVPTSAVLEAAQHVFAESGYQGASMSTIARGCGVTKAALYNHFSSKEALYIAVLEDIATRLGSLVEQALKEPGELLERIDALGEAVVRYLGAHPPASRLLIREFVDVGPFLKSPQLAVIGRVVEATAQLLTAGIASGEIAPQDPRHLAGSIIGLHLHWFATRPLAAALVGDDPFVDEQVEARVKAVQRQVRALCR